MRKAVIYFLLYLVLTLALSYAVDGVFQLFKLNGDGMVTLKLLVTSGITSVAVIALFILKKWCHVSREYVRTKPWGVFFWTVLLSLGIILPLAWFESFIPKDMLKDLTDGVLASALDGPEGYFVICMLAPLAEEVVFRGAVIQALTRWGRERMKKDVLTDREQSHINWLAILVSAFIFALVHLNPAQMPHALIVGVLLGWMYTRTGSIVPGFLLHWINNSSAYVMLKLFPSLPMDAALPDYFHGNTMAMYQAVGSSLLIALPALYQFYLFTKKGAVKC